MSYCKYCQDLLKIVKNKDYDNNTLRKINKEDIINILINKLNAKDGDYIDSEYNYQIDFSVDEIDSISISASNIKKLKMSKEEIKEELIILYNEIVKDNKDANLFNLVCNNCSMTYYLRPGTIVDSVNLTDSNFVQDEIPSIRVHDPTLFRTKDFTCVNRKCISNTDNSKKIQTEKEAVFYKLNTHNIKYICSQCNTQWGT